eukprot:gene2215-2389_t
MNFAIPADNHWTYTTNRLAEKITISIPFLTSPFNVKVMNSTNYDKFKIGNPTYQSIVVHNKIDRLAPTTIKNDNVTNYIVIIENSYNTATLGGFITIKEEFQFSSASSKILQVLLGLLVSIPGLIVAVLLVIILLFLVGGVITYIKRKNWSEMEKEQRSSLVNQDLSDDDDEIPEDTQLEELNEKDIEEALTEDDELLKKSLLEIAQSKSVDE